jgi:hypothetical protein
MGETSIRSTVIAGQTEGLMVGCGWVGGFMVDLWRKGGVRVGFIYKRYVQ